MNGKENGVQNGDQKENRRIALPKMPSRAITALVAFLVVCQVMSALKVGARPPQDVPYPTWTSWAIDEFIDKNARKPELVFMGSSLMLVPLDGVDADFTKETIDASAHHKSIFFEKRFKDLTGMNVNTYNFALPGEMPSDAYLITKNLLKGENRPNVIVYGVGPRDFMDNLLPSPAATDPFRYLSRFGPYRDRIDLIAPKWDERLAYELGQLLYPLEKSTDIRMSVEENTAEFLSGIMPVSDASSNILLRRKLLPNYHPFEIQPGECFFRPTTAESRGGFVDNIEEYRKRYKDLKWDTFIAQMRFLSDIMNISEERGIEFVLVAMPITDINRQLLSDHAWVAYKESLRALARSKNATFIDMHETGAFPLSDFGDTVHLHSGGGARLLDMLAKRLSNNHSVLSALNIRGEDSRSLAGLKESQL